MNSIPVAGPSITSREINYVTQAAREAWYDQAGMFHHRFEQAFARYIGVKHAVSVPHCTAALHLSLLALGIGPGDEVIVPDITWIASAAPITYVGATPVFADVAADSWCLCPQSLRERITPRTRAIIPVDLYGNMPEWNEILAIAAEHDLAVIEDAAEAFGSSYQNRMAGSLGITGTFSFHGSKTMTTGEGGMLVTDRDDVYERVLVLRDHGRAPGDIFFDNYEVAYKYKMSAMQAAMGLAQTERAEELVSAKRDIFAWYQEELQDLPELQWNPEPRQGRNSYWMTTVILPEAWNISKREAMTLLAEQGISSRPFFHPLTSLKAYSDHPQAKAAPQLHPNSYRLAPLGINLPSALSLSRSDVKRVAMTVRRLKHLARQKAA